VNPDCIAVMGFSAGGHLTASAGVFWSKPHYAQLIGLTPEQVKPNALILGYPVISSDTTVSHGASIRNLLGDTYDALKDTVSLEHQVDEHTPPYFPVAYMERCVSTGGECAALCQRAARTSGQRRGAYIHGWPAWAVAGQRRGVWRPDADSIRPACQNWIDMAAAYGCARWHNRRSGAVCAHPLLRAQMHILRFPILCRQNVAAGRLCTRRWRRKLRAQASCTAARRRTPCTSAAARPRC
jgi:hypothetical protein